MARAYLLIQINRFGTLNDIVQVYESRSVAKAEEKRRNNKLAQYEYAVISRPIVFDGEKVKGRSE